MKKAKKLLCLFTTAILSVSAFAGAASSYCYGTSYNYNDAEKTNIGGLTYILKENVKYGSVEFPYSATVIDIPNIEKVEVPEKITCSGTEFTVTDVDLYGRKMIYPEMPYKYTKVEEIKLPETIYNITEFGEFPNLKKLNIPKNTVIGREEKNFERSIYTENDFYYNYECNYRCYFLQCPKLKLSLNKDNPNYNYKDDMILSKDGKKVYMSLNHSTDITIPDGVEKINDEGGLGFYHVKTIKLPDTLKSLWGTWSSLTKVSLPNGLEEIGVGTFNSTKLNKIVFPDSLKEIGDSAFACSAIKSIKFGKNLKTIGKRAFKKCNNLKIATLPKNLKKIDNWAFKGCKKLKKVKILSTDVEICGRAFEKCTNLKSVDINKAKVIKCHAFSRCSSLKSVTIKETSKIERGAFYKCKKLSKVKIGNKKKAPKIEKRAFKDTKKGVRFYVKNKKVAKSLKKRLKGSGVKNAKILVGNTVVYKNVK